MKANISFQKSIFDEVPERVVVYADSKADILAVVDGLSESYVVSNVYISDDKKEDK